MVTRRRVMLLSALGLMGAHALSRAQPSSGIHRVGVLLTRPQASNSQLGAFRDAMRELGWVEGGNVEYRTVSANGDVDRLDALAIELIRDNVELIVAASSAGTRAAQRATKTIPIVMVAASNAVESGFVASLGKPGGNITGVSNQREEAFRKLIQILHEVVPDARRIGILLNERNPSYRTLEAAAQSACSALKLAALPALASDREQLSGAVSEMTRRQSQAVVVMPDPVYLDERVNLHKLLQAARLPAAYGLRDHVIAGGLLSYAADLSGNYRSAARYVDRILKGARPAELPVEQPTKYELTVNLNTAQALGITIPQSVLVRVDEVIK